MVEQGTLELRTGERGMSQEEAYCLLATPAYGCSWNVYQVFGQLKKFGYIVGRHGVPWTLQENLWKDEPKASLTHGKLELTFDVHKPSGQFQKAKPGAPAFSVCIAWYKHKSVAMKLKTPSSASVLVSECSISFNHITVHLFLTYQCLWTFLFMYECMITLNCSSYH